MNDGTFIKRYLLKMTLTTTMMSMSLL